MPRIVKKFNGDVEPFDPEKIVRSIVRAGGSRELGEIIAKRVIEKLGDLNEVTTTQIRRVVLIELDKENHLVKDAYLFYDRVVKGRITFEAGKFLVVRSGAIFMGKNVRDIGESGLTHLDEVRGLIDEFEEDMLVGGYREELAESRSRVLIHAIRNSKMSKQDKENAIKLVNSFRRRHSFDAIVEYI